jgi:hypothetical protein
MDERQRDELLGKVRGTNSTIGADIPESITVDGETVPIREVYFEVSGHEELPAADRERVDAILSYLRRRRLALVQQIQRREVDYETGESLVDEVRDLDRAINAFESLEDPSLAEQVRREEIESARELVDMMRQFGKL